jgi:hypothetical protein
LKQGAVKNAKNRQQQNAPLNFACCPKHNAEFSQGNCNQYSEKFT